MVFQNVSYKRSGYKSEDANIDADWGTWDTSVHVMKSVLGAVCASLFSIVYYVAPFYMVVTAFLVLKSLILIAQRPLIELLNIHFIGPFIIAMPILISAVTNPQVFPQLFLSFPISCVHNYFQYREFIETGDDELLYHINHIKPGMFHAAAKKLN